MADIRFDMASRTYPGLETPAVDGLNLAIADGEFLVLVGPSGSGKSTALRMLAGLEPIDSGAIQIGGVDMTLVPPRNRDLAMVFQSYALYPSMTVAANMGFALKQSRVPRRQRDRRVAEVAKILGLEDLLDRRPKHLSGGERQRVAMGRAIVRDPSAFLMDEPLSNLDAKLRTQTRTEISQLQARLGVTTVYVTHDQVEAMTMGDRVAVLDGGRLQQVGTPRELYARPANLFVAGFIGSPAMNLISAPISGGQVRLGSTPIPLQGLRARSGEDLVIGVRPEALSLADEGIPGRVTILEELGADAYVFVEFEHLHRTETLMVRTDGAAPPARGDDVHIAITGDHHVFDEAGYPVRPPEDPDDDTPGSESRRVDARLG